MTNNLDKNLRAAIYARVSSEEQREGQTIDSQINELERLAEQKGWHVIRIFKDEGWTGSILARPNLDRLRDDASKNLFDLVLVNDVDRLARDVTHLGIIKRDLERHDVRLVFKKLPDENSPTHNLMVNILGSFAEFERQMIADRTRRGTRYKIEVRKQYLGGCPPYGFRYIPKDRSNGKDGYLEIHPEEAAVVRDMFTWLDREGLTARQVTDRLSRLKIPARKKQNSWGRSSVLRILHCEMYAGIWHYNKHKSCEPYKPRTKARYRTPNSSCRLRPKSEWLPVPLPEKLKIIDHDQWERVQVQLQKNISFSPRNSKHEYLLKSLVRCGGCSRPYVGDPVHGVFYYRCSVRCRKYGTIKEETLNQTIWNAIAEAILNPKLLEDQIEELAQRQKARTRRSESESNVLKSSLDQLKLEEERLLEIYRRGILSATLLGQELEKLNARRMQVESKRRALSQCDEPRKIEDIKNSLRTFCAEAATRLTHFDFFQRRQFLRLLIKSIIFSGDVVTIKTVIPMDSPSNGSSNSYSSAELSAEAPVRGIAPTPIEPDGHSTPLQNKDFSVSHNENDSEGFEFTIEKPIVRRKNETWKKLKRSADGTFQSPFPPPMV